MKYFLLIFTAFTLIFSSIEAKTTRSTANGNWNASGTWDNGIPTVSDTAIIENGNTVTVTNNAAIRHLYITDNLSSLVVNTGVTVDIIRNFGMLPTANGQTNSLTVNGRIQARTGFSPRTENGFTGYTAEISGSGSIDNWTYFFPASFNNGTMVVNLSCDMECRDLYNYTDGSSSSMILNLKDSINVTGNIILQSVNVSASANQLSMNHSNARLKLGGVINFVNNGGQITQGTAESIFYFGNLSSYLAHANIDYRNIGIESQSISSAINITKLDNNFIIPSGKTLSGSGSVTISEGNLRCDGGTANATISLAGSSAQTITANSNTDIAVLDISNTSGGVSVSGSGNLNITQGITFTTAAATTFNTGGKVTLKDNGSGMAYLGNLNSHSISGNLTCEFRTQTLSNIEYRLFTVPLSGQTLGSVDYNASNCPNCFYSYGFTGSNTPSSGGVASTYTYNNGSVTSAFDEGWTMASNTSNAVSPQQGLTWYIGPGTGSGSAASYEIDVTGTPNTGPYTINSANGANFTASGSGADFNWALVGNPFPSTINFATVTQNNVDKDPWLFKADNGGYAIDNTIPPFQAFFVKIVGSGASLVFNESDKVTTQKVYQKNFKEGEEIQVKLSTPLYPNKFNYTYLRFNENASNGFDTVFDKEQFSNPFPYPNVSMQTADGKNTYRYVTNPKQGHIAIPINAHGYTSGTYELSFANLGSMEGCLILEDTYTGQQKGVSALDSTYSFTLSDTTKGARFVLHVYNMVEELTVNNSNCFGANAGSAEVKFYNPGSHLTFWFDDEGNYFAGNPNATVSDIQENLKPGNYSIEIEPSNLNCPAITEYFTIHEGSEMIANFGFANQLLSFRTDKAIEFKNLSEGGISDYLWEFGDAISSNEKNPTHSYASPGVYDVVLTAGNGNPDCKVMHKQSIEVAEATGLSELSGSKSYQIYYQNGNYWVHFNTPSKYELNYSIYDIQGKELSNGSIPSGSLVEQLNCTADGILLISLNYNDEVETIKVHK